MSLFKKEIIRYKNFYISKFIKYKNEGFLFFIHGGPGYHCGIIEYLIEHDGLFEKLNHNIILYDQRGCGRSNNGIKNIAHQQNIDDLNDIFHFFKNETIIKIKGFIGHSYGAKLLFDYYKIFNSQLPGIFVSTANSILTPRLNNLVFDLAYLKKSNPAKYQDIFLEVRDFSVDKLWEVTEKVSSLFYENKDKDYLYWANMDVYQKVQKIKDIINLPINTQAFLSIRKDLYSNPVNFSVDIASLNSPYLWINGFYDTTINAVNDVVSSSIQITTLYQSSHYPHLEENERFCAIINQFMKER